MDVVGATIVTTMPDDFMTGEEVCAKLRIAPQTLTAWVRDGQVKAYKLGARTYRYSAAEIDAYIAATYTDRSAS